MRLMLFVAASLALLLLLWPAVLLWRRYYREGEGNTARRVLKNSAVPTLLRLLVRALDFTFAFVLYGLLPADSIGRYGLAALLVVQYLGTISEFGLGVLLTREAAREPGAAERLFGTTLVIRWLLAVAAVPVAGLLIATYGLLGRTGLGEAIAPEGQQAIWVLLLTLLPAGYSGAVTALYNAAERMEVPALVELVTALLSFLARIAVLLLGFGILGLAWAAVAVTFLTAAIYFVLQTHAFFVPRLEWDGQLARSLLPLALPLMLNNLLSAVFFRFDAFLIKGLGGGAGDALVSQYNLAYQVLNIPMILPPVITFAVFPVLARRASGARSALAEAQNRTLQMLLLLAFPVAMGLSVLAPDLVQLFTRRNYPSFLLSVDALAILAWFLPLSFVNGLLQYVLIAVNRQRAITWAFAAGALFNLLANLLLIPWYGLYAASAITICSEIVLLLIFMPLLRREGLRPPLAALAWRPALAALAMGAAMLGIGTLFWGSSSAVASLNWARLGAMCLVALPAYAAGLWILGAFGPEERALLRRAIGIRSHS